MMLWSCFAANSIATLYKVDGNIRLESIQMCAPKCFLFLKDVCCAIIPPGKGNHLKPKLDIHAHSHSFLSSCLFTCLSTMLQQAEVPEDSDDDDDPDEVFGFITMLNLTERKVR